MTSSSHRTAVVRPAPGEPLARCGHRRLRGEAAAHDDLVVGILAAGAQVLAPARVAPVERLAAHGRGAAARCAGGPRSCRCASASSVPASTSRRTLGSPWASASTTTTGGAPGARSDAGGSAAKKANPSIDAVLERLDGGLAAGPVGVVDEHDDVPGLLRGPVRAAQRQAEERMGHVGDDEPDGGGDAGAQRPCGGVGPVAELARGALHGLGGRLGDAAGRLAGQHERHRRLRHARATGDVDARDARAGA